ncbi:MAG: coproporphyrinogen III oxidase family protein [Phycisphaerales bacterium]|nr:coproporphyrinogen III oxidase family protein [Phycisphaerales bacterium]
MQTALIINDDARTEVGSYFVANYPPFSVWTPDQAPAALDALNRPRAEGRAEPLGLYVHIPFCRRRCKFCYFRVYTDKNARDVDVYLDALAREVALYAHRPAVAGRSFEFVYFGGGTPSFLSAEQLKRLVGRIGAHWSWEAAREVTFECEPGTLQKGKLETIKEIGVTRLSLGIEHFDDAILELNGRAHRSPEIVRAYDWAREIGFNQINIDLIAGLMGDDDAKWDATVDRAIELDADSVTIYQMEVPHNTEVARASQAGCVEAPLPNWATKRRWVDDAFRRFEAHGYDISSAYTLVKPERHAGFVYRDALWHGADMVGMGVASFSHFAGVHYQNLDRWEDYIARLEGGKLPIHRALRVSPRQRMIREFVLQMKTGRVDPAYFRRKFAVDVNAEFAAAWSILNERGYTMVDGDAIALTRDGLLRVDALLPLFFDAEFRDIRYT